MSSTMRTPTAAERIEKENPFEIIIKNTMEGFLLFDVNANIVDVNDSYCKMIGYTRDELLTMSLKDIKILEKGDSVEKVIQMAIEESPLRYQTKHRHKNGTVIDVEISSTYLSDLNQFFVFLHDMTEKNRLEKEKQKVYYQQIQHQRLEAIGTLATEIVHEINNPINGIMNYSQLILDTPGAVVNNAGYAKEILFESERIVAIVKNLLQFSRQEEHEYSYARVETIIEQTLSLFNAVIRHDQIDLQIDIPENLPDIRCRGQQIQQVIMNLLTNACDALNDKYPEYCEDKIVKIYCREFMYENRPWIRMVVEDHGNGIPQEVQPRLFEPFFTTKARNKGTGLGLSISYEIVKDHHGKLTFETEEGKYTRFYVELPIT